MVVPASEFQTALQVAVPDSQSGMGAGQGVGMPTAQDSPVPSIGGEPATGAAPQQDAPPINVEQIDPQIRAYLESHFRQGYVPSGDLDGLRSTKDTELSKAQAQVELERVKAETALAQVQLAKNAFNQYVSEILSGKRTAHANDVAVLQLAMQNAGQQVAYTRGSAAAQHREWEAGHDAGFQQEVQRLAQGGDGIPAIASTAIANDPEVQRLDRELRQAAQADAKELFRNQAHTRRAESLSAQLRARMEHVASVARIQAVAAPVVQELQTVDANLARQQARGVQTSGLLTAGALAGTWNDDTAWEQARNQIAAKYGMTPATVEAEKYDDIYAAWKTAFDAATRR